MEQRAGGQIDQDLASLKELLAVSRTAAGKMKGW
jgi:hypothetical protein